MSSRHADPRPLYLLLQMNAPSSCGCRGGPQFRIQRCGSNCPPAPLPRPPLLCLLARVMAPYVAVAIGLLWLRSAWLTIILYHAQMLFWSRRGLARLRRGWDVRLALPMVLPAALSGPLTYLLLPRMLSVPLDQWLASIGLRGPAFVGFVLYYGLVHPPIEQTHWSALRRDGRLGVTVHLFFAAYHALVLQAFMRPEWALLSLAVLFGSSIVWHRVERQTGGLAIPALSHLVGDLGMVIAVWARL